MGYHRVRTSFFLFEHSQIRDYACGGARVKCTWSNFSTTCSCRTSTVQAQTLALCSRPNCSVSPYHMAGRVAVGTYHGLRNLQALFLICKLYLRICHNSIGYARARMCDFNCECWLCSGLGRRWRSCSLEQQGLVSLSNPPTHLGVTQLAECTTSPTKQLRARPNIPHGMMQGLLGPLLRLKQSHNACWTPTLEYILRRLSTCRETWAGSRV